MSRTPGWLLGLAVVFTVPASAFAIGLYNSRTTAECRDKVNANYDALIADMRKNGNVQGIAVVNARGRIPDLQNCENIDRQKQGPRMVKAFQALSTAIETLKSGGSISKEEQLRLDEDRKAIAGFNPAPYRDACLQLYDDYQRYLTAASQTVANKPSATKIHRCIRANGEIEYTQRTCETGASQAEVTIESRGGGATPSWKLCDEYRAQIAALKKEHDGAVDALLPKQSADGTSVRTDDWRMLNERRERTITEWQFVESRARAAGCGP